MSCVYCCSLAPLLSSRVSFDFFGTFHTDTKSGGLGSSQIRSAGMPYHARIGKNHGLQNTYVAGVALFVMLF